MGSGMAVSVTSSIRYCVKPVPTPSFDQRNESVSVIGIAVFANSSRRQLDVPLPVGWAGIPIGVQSVPFELYSKSSVVMSDAFRFLWAPNEMDTEPGSKPIVEIPEIINVAVPLLVKNTLAKPLAPLYVVEAVELRRSPVPLNDRELLSKPLAVVWPANEVVLVAVPKVSEKITDAACIEPVAMSAKIEVSNVLCNFISRSLVC